MAYEVEGIDGGNSCASSSRRPESFYYQPMNPVAHFQLPFRGRWFVGQAGDTLNVNHHMSMRGQWHGVDFIKADGSEARSLFHSDGTTLEDFFAWGEPVLAPADGIIETAVDNFPDLPVGTKDRQQVCGNYVVIKAAAARFLFLAHLQKGSVCVQVGQNIRAGQELGRCGNSGHSDCPHLHLHLQTTPTLGTGEGQNMIFRHIDVELSGKVFENVDWPLISGLFVRPTNAISEF